jgi:hypothetical protein
VKVKGTKKKKAKVVEADGKGKTKKKAVGKANEIATAIGGGSGNGPKLGPAGLAIRDKRDGFSLRPYVANALAAADEAFGEHSYAVFVASDAPAVKYYVRELSAASGSRAKVVFHEMKTGHNAGRFSPPSVEARSTMDEYLEVQRSTAVDLILLSEATLLVSMTSKFTEAAHLRDQCGQRHIKVQAYPRHGLAEVGAMLDAALHRRDDGAAAGRGGGGRRATVVAAAEERWVPDFDAASIATLEATLPSGLNGAHHECFDDPSPTRSCMCYFKLAHAAP